jgi:hypothetical protein
MDEMSLKDRLRRVAGRPMMAFQQPMLSLPKSLDGWKDHRMRFLAVAILRLEHKKGSNRDLKALILFNQEVISACQSGQYDKVNQKLGLLRNYMKSLLGSQNRRGRGKGLHLSPRGELDPSLGDTLKKQLHYLEEYKEKLQPLIIDKCRAICDHFPDKANEEDRGRE